MNTDQVLQMWASTRLTLDNIWNATTLFAESEGLPKPILEGGGLVFLPDPGSVSSSEKVDLPANLVRF
jgi:hypothetical protein